MQVSINFEYAICSFTLFLFLSRSARLGQETWVVMVKFFIRYDVINGPAKTSSSCCCRRRRRLQQQPKKSPCLIVRTTAHKKFVGVPLCWP